MDKNFWEKILVVKKFWVKWAFCVLPTEKILTKLTYKHISSYITLNQSVYIHVHIVHISDIIYLHMYVHVHCSCIRTYIRRPSTGAYLPQRPNSSQHFQLLMPIFGSENFVGENFP